MIDVAGISASTISLLAALSRAFSLLTTQLFNKYFKDWEYRGLIQLNALFAILIAPLTLIYALRLNLGMGIPDLFCIIITEYVSWSLGRCFVFLLIQVIITKICPKHIEATSFAFMAIILNVRGLLSSYTGSWINEIWVGCTQSDLSDYWKLVVIPVVCSLLPPLFFIWLIPKRKSIEDIQHSENKETLQKVDSCDKPSLKSKKID